MAKSKSKPPPPPKGHRRSVKHGAKAKVPAVRVEAKSAELAVQIAATAPVRTSSGALPAHDEQAVAQLATTLCRLADVGKWLDREGSLDRKGKPRSAALWERRLKNQALREMAALGLTPQSRAKLGLALARTVDLASAMSQEDPQLRKIQLAELGVAADEQ
jgi:hypothetical protein